MSHNAQVINGVEPNALSQYSGVIARPIVLIGRGLTAAYSTSGASDLSVNTNVRFYDTSPINSITGATLNGSADWYQSVTLPAGTFFIRAYFSVLFSATGLLELGLHTGSIYIGSRAVVGGTAGSTYDGGGFASTTITLASTTTIALRIASASNVSAIASQGNTPAQESWLLVERLI